MLILATERLRLLALSRAHLLLYLNQPRRLEQTLGLAVSRAVMNDAARRAAVRKVARMQAVPRRLHPWYTYWLAVIEAQGLGAGLLGFKAPPNARGEVEIAYSIDPAYERRGHTTEAARALIDWAFTHAECRAVVAPGTPRANVASNRVLAKLGMRVYAETPRALSWRLGRWG